MNMGWPFWIVAALMAAYVAYIVSVNLFDAIIRNWKN